MQRVLVAVDGSERSIRAIDKAADLAVHYQIPLVGALSSRILGTELPFGAFVDVTSSVSLSSEGSLN